MTELEFKALAAAGYNRIPLIAESFADLDTPLSLYLKLVKSQGAGHNSFLLESVVGGERFGRFEPVRGTQPASDSKLQVLNCVPLLQEDVCFDQQIQPFLPAHAAKET